MSKQKIVVVGAGAFGGWTALMLLRKGYDVTLIEAWEAGHSRSSSGDETRIIRSVYEDKIYAEMTQRAMQLWRENEKVFSQRIFFPIGVLNLLGKNPVRWQKAAQHFDDLGIAYQAFSVQEARKKYPFINFDDIDYASIEWGGGYLLARMGCCVVKEAFIREGGTYKIAAALPFGAVQNIKNGRLAALQLADGTALEADAFVFACGAWLGKLFPEQIGDWVRPTRQEIFYFGVPQGSTIMRDLPVWCDYGTREAGILMYGIPAAESDAEGRGFKIGRDVAGEQIDPDTLERLNTAAEIAETRDFMAYRFPILRGMPLIEGRVCQYENTLDAHFIVDKLPETDNIWIAGGGSGHGYKHGAAVGDMLADMIAEERAIEPTFMFKRFDNLTETVERR